MSAEALAGPGPDCVEPGRDEISRDAHVDAVVRALRAVAQAQQAHSRWVEKQCGLSAPQLWAMWLLQGSPGLRVSDLSRLMSIHPSTASNMLDKLEKRGLVRRARGVVDHREVRLHTTEQGEAILGTAPRPAQGRVTFALQRLTDEQLAGLACALDQLIDAMRIGDPDPSLVPMPSS